MTFKMSTMMFSHPDKCSSVLHFLLRHPLAYTFHRVQRYRGCRVTSGPGQLFVVAYMCTLVCESRAENVQMQPERPQSTRCVNTRPRI